MGDGGSSRGARVRTRVQGDGLLLSATPAYPLPCEALAEDVHIVGKVVWSLRRV